MRLYNNFFESPIGYVEVKGTDTGIVTVNFVDEPAPKQEHMLLEHCLDQLKAYFAGVLNKFDVPLAPSGTPFQQQVWQHVSKIPFGQQASYADIAQAVGSPNAHRAVGSAVGKNRLALLIPCHRVVPKSHKLSGFAWEPWRKEWLLQHENNR